MAITYNYLKEQFQDEISERSRIKNDINGHQKIGCLIFSKNGYSVLWERYKSLQY